MTGPTALPSLMATMRGQGIGLGLAEARHRPECPRAMPSARRVSSTVAFGTVATNSPLQGCLISMIRSRVILSPAKRSDSCRTLRLGVDGGTVGLKAPFGVSTGRAGVGKRQGPEVKRVATLSPLERRIRAGLRAMRGNPERCASRSGRTLKDPCGQRSRQQRFACPRRHDPVRGAR